MIKFISYEPALGPLKPGHHSSLPDWLICGGETGGGARVMKKRWAQLLLEECQASQVAFFLKQMTGKAAIPEDLLGRQFPRLR